MENRLNDLCNSAIKQSHEFVTSYIALYEQRKLERKDIFTHYDKSDFWHIDNQRIIIKSVLGIAETLNKL